MIYLDTSVALAHLLTEDRSPPEGLWQESLGHGLVASLAAPGGNVTGVTNAIDSLAPKRVELLLQILPGAKTLGLLGDPNDPRLALERSSLTSMVSALGLTLVVGEASNPAEFDTAVAKLIGQRVQAILASTSISTNLRGRLVELANRRRLPAMCRARIS